jgi:repressor of nif and glnA expression
MKYVKAFGQFWYDFIIGDDWKIAVAVVCALGVTLVLLKAGLFSDPVLTTVGGLLVVVLFAVSIAIDVRPRKK